MEYIKVTKEGHVLEIGLNRPNKMNAFNWKMLGELSEAYTMLEKDPDAWVGILYSTSENFTAGIDLADVTPHIMEGEYLFDLESIDPTGISGKQLSKPMVVAVNGYCLTIGIELFLAADICISNTNTIFGQIEVQRGILPFGGATIRMTRRAGWGNAMKYLLTGQQFDSEEAYRIGLVQEISDDPLISAKKLAALISDQAPLGVRSILENARLSLVDEDKAKKELNNKAIELMQTEDAKEGLTSFLERRKAIFKGK